MILDINVHLHYQIPTPTDILLQIEAPHTPDQSLLKAQIDFGDMSNFARVTAEDAIGERIWLSAQGDFICDYTARVQIERPKLILKSLPAVAPHMLPADTVKYLMPSRYCPSDEFQNFVTAEFGNLAGGERVVAMRDWIATNFSYVSGSSNAQTTALDSFVQRQGVCRDFAHVMITLARASTIPARFVSAYAPNVQPQDFHAVAEVFLDGTWHLVDSTGMAEADNIARIGVGADAASVAFMSSFGPVEMLEQVVTVNAG